VHWVNRVKLGTTGAPPRPLQEAATPGRRTAVGDLSRVGRLGPTA
jgi:hypothetical protein